MKYAIFYMKNSRWFKYRDCFNKEMTRVEAEKWARMCKVEKKCPVQIRFQTWQIAKEV